MKRTELTKLIKAIESADGSQTQLILNERYSIIAHSVYLYSNGPHRAWKRIYDLKDNQAKFPIILGGFDNRDWFVTMVCKKIDLNTI